MYHHIASERVVAAHRDIVLGKALQMAGDGYRIHCTGLTHDERGYPAMTAEAQDTLVHRLVDKIQTNAHDIIQNEEDDLEDAEVVLIAYGITSRVARAAVQRAREEGLGTEVEIGELPDTGDA